MTQTNVNVFISCFYHYNIMIYKVYIK